MIHAEVTPKLALPARTDGWKKIACPAGLTIAKKGGVIAFTAEDEARAALQQLAGRLAMQTGGTLVVDGEKLVPKIDAPLKKLYAAVAKADTTSDVAAVGKALVDLRAKLESKEVRKGAYRVADARLAKRARSNGDDDPVVQFGKPASKAQLAKLDRAFERKLGHPTPEALRAFLLECDGLGGSWFRTFGSVDDILAGCEEDWSAVPLASGGEGPGIVAIGDGALVVDIWHETPGDAGGAGWPVLAVGFGSWLSAFVAAGMDAASMKSPWSDVTTPALLDWTDAHIAQFWSTAAAPLPAATRDWRMEAFNALAAGKHDDVITAATHLRKTPREWARGTFFLATAFDALGQKAEAERTLDELIARYVSADPVPPPGMHARLALELAELEGLVRSVLGERAATALATIRDAPPLSEDGDFL